MKILTAILLCFLTSQALAQNYETPPQSNLTQIDITTEYTGKGILVGNIDGWPNLGHSDLSGQGAYARVYPSAGYNAVSWNAGHSSVVMGIINGKKNSSGIVGVAPEAYVWTIPIWTPQDTLATTSAGLQTAYNYLQGRGVRVVNKEIQFARLLNGQPAIEAIFAPGDLDRIAQYPGMVFVQPVGNQGKVILNQYYLSSADSLSHLLLVGSVNGDNGISSFSNVPQERCLYKAGETVCKEENKLKNFFVVAPGSGVLSSVPSSVWQRWNGTSFSAPHVSGLLALMFEKANRLGKPLPAKDAARIVKETSTDLGAPGVDGTYGYGLVNVRRALDAVR